jgi:tRNA (guanosine-2'-O-)-methyltransferase
MNSQRYARICEMLARRQPDLTVCMEQVHKPHNVSAVIRTADAVGVHEVHAIWPSSRMRTMASAAAGSNSWVQVKTHRTIGDAVSHLKARACRSSPPIFPTKPSISVKSTIPAQPAS